MMLIGIAPLSCLALSLALTFAEASIPLHLRRDEASKLFETDDVEAVKGNSRADRSADSVGKVVGHFLAGEDTPVWIAYHEHPNDTSQLTYRRLEKGIVKQAIDHLKSDEFKWVKKGKRSVDEHTYMLREDREYADTHPSIARLSKRPKREDDSPVFYPSVLAVMEYEHTWPSNEKDERVLILERILYALAYWNSVDLYLREIEDPRVRIRLAGIVIAKNKDITNNMYEAYYYREFLHYEGTLNRLAEYWGDRMRRKPEFRSGAYNIVALMTDDTEAPEKESVPLLPDGLPCDHDKPGAAGILISSDNLEFSGLQNAVSSTARMLGHGSGNNSECQYKSKWINKAWNKCDLESIRESLTSNGWCMTQPMDLHDPGKPVERVLPGMLTSLEQQCKAGGWDAGHVCRKWSCDALSCQEDYLSLCLRRHRALDGSECGVGMVGCDSEEICYTD